MTKTAGDNKPRPISSANNTSMRKPAAQRIASSAQDSKVGVKPIAKTQSAASKAKAASAKIKKASAGKTIHLVATAPGSNSSSKKTKLSKAKGDETTQAVASALKTTLELSEQDLGRKTESASIEQSLGRATDSQKQKQSTLQFGLPSNLQQSRVLGPSPSDKSQ